MKLKSLLSFLLVLEISIAGCDKEDDPIKPYLLEYTVLDATNRTPSNPQAQLSENATVNIFITEESYNNNRPTYIGKTDRNGVLSINIEDEQVFFVTAEKEKAKSFKNGYLIQGIFDTQEKINDFSKQTPPAQIGDLVLMDYNGDGIVDNLDQNKAPSYYGIKNIGLNQYRIYISE